MSSVFFSVEGNPIPKQSYRHGTGRGRHHQPQRVLNWQELVAVRAMQAMNGLPLFEGNVAILSIFRRGDKRRVDDGNLSKAVDDALNGVVWIDDSQVTYRITIKNYDKENPGVMVRVWEMI